MSSTPTRKPFDKQKALRISIAIEKALEGEVFDKDDIEIIRSILAGYVVVLSQGKFPSAWEKRCSHVDD